MPTISTRITIQAPIERVWEVLTTPDLVHHWRPGSELVADWHAGGEIILKGTREGKPIEQRGRVLELVPKERIVYSLFVPEDGLEDRPEHRLTVHLELTAEESGWTSLAITQEDERPGSESRGGDESGQVVLQQFKSFVEVGR